MLRVPFLPFFYAAPADPPPDVAPIAADPARAFGVRVRPSAAPALHVGRACRLRVVLAGSAAAARILMLRRSAAA
ncbi:MAG TPA: hypothetical protein VF006_32520 [Longimicrobium sp.]